MQMSHFLLSLFIFCGLICLIKEQMQDMQIMQPYSQNVALGTNLGVIIKTPVKLYLGGFKEIRPVLISLKIFKFKTNM